MVEIYLNIVCGVLLFILGIITHICVSEFFTRRREREKIITTEREIERVLGDLRVMKRENELLRKFYGKEDKDQSK